MQTFVVSGMSEAKFPKQLKKISREEKIRFLPYFCLDEEMMHDYLE